MDNIRHALGGRISKVHWHPAAAGTQRCSECLGSRTVRRVAPDWAAALGVGEPWWASMSGVGTDPTSGAGGGGTGEVEAGPAGAGGRLLPAGAGGGWWRPGDDGPDGKPRRQGQGKGRRRGRAQMEYPPPPARPLTADLSPSGARVLSPELAAKEKGGPATAGYKIEDFVLPFIEDD